jgi:hypothetical protein
MSAEYPGHDNCPICKQQLPAEPDPRILPRPDPATRVPAPEVGTATAYVAGYNAGYAAAKRGPA